MATADLTVLALGRKEPSASEYIAEIQRRLLGQQCVYTVLKLDERRDRPRQTLEDKVRSVEHRLGGDL